MLLKGILCAVALKNIDSYLEDTMPACASVVGMPQSCVCVCANAWLWVCHGPHLGADTGAVTHAGRVHGVGTHGRTDYRKG